MIARFKKMRERLTESEHHEIADEHEEYWRLRFYTLLQDNKENFTMSYLPPVMMSMRLMSFLVEQ